MPDKPPRRYRYLDPRILQEIGPLELAAREIVEGMRVGIHKSPLRGFSTEFAQHRPYVPGDALKHIDWRVYARTSRYYLKTYEAETNFSAYLLLDASRSMHYRARGLSKLEYAKFMAASLAHLIVQQRDSVGLAVFDAELRAYVEPKGQLGIVRNIAQSLESVEPVPRTDIAGLLHRLAGRLPRRGFVLLFSDLLDTVDEFLRGLCHLRFRGHNVVVFHILDPDELEFPFRGVHKFKGLENEGELVTQPGRIRAVYLRELNAFTDRIRKACRRSRIDYVMVNTARPVEAVLSEFLLLRMRTC